MKKISFITGDNVKLDGLLYEPDSIGKDVIIAVHGMSSNCFKKRDDILANEFNRNNISYFCFNNRGHDLAVFLDKYSDGKKTKIISGTSYEDVLDSYYDITGAIEVMLNIGYERIHLQGHSLGSTKIVYTYNRLKVENKAELLSKIYSVILLSLVDIPEFQKLYLGDKFNKVLEYANNMETENKLIELIPQDMFGSYLSVKTFLRLSKYNEEIDFARYGDSNYNFDKLNNIDIPLFMRWGNIKEMIIQNPDYLVNLLKSKINNPKLDVGYIDGADHSYGEKELILADQILSFIKNNAF